MKPDRICCDGECTYSRGCPRIEPRQEESSIPSIVVGSVCLTVVLVTLALLTNAK